MIDCVEPKLSVERQFAVMQRATILANGGKKNTNRLWREDFSSRFFQALNQSQPIYYLSLENYWQN
jgi:hypothetical protein